MTHPEKLTTAAEMREYLGRDAQEQRYNAQAQEVALGLVERMKAQRAMFAQACYSPHAFSQTFFPRLDTAEVLARACTLLHDAGYTAHVTENLPTYRIEAFLPEKP